jgi:hypothetical protein
MKAAPRALLLPGLMNHVRINDADVMRESAGCLTCESENALAAGPPTAVIPDAAKRRSGIQFRRESRFVWIPGSRASPAPRNDSEVRGSGYATRRYSFGSSPL